ncbi:MAG: DUF1801 domain-containing protein, partial [Ktedonobacteraceae bacterium]|nr:DUF1801 domain-containing protein [Ktedonobacteraceae bacterium]
MIDKNRKSQPTVDFFLSALDHPLKREIVALRQILLEVDPAISEEIKWNSPSFRTSQHFATMHLRAKDSLQLILHLGSKKRSVPMKAIVDSDGLLKWLGPDRASVSFRSSEDLAANGS